MANQPYTKTPWVDNETPLNASNMNNIEDALVDLSTSLHNITVASDDIYNVAENLESTQRKQTDNNTNISTAIQNTYCVSVNKRLGRLSLTKNTVTINSLLKDS